MVTLYNYVDLVEVYGIKLMSIRSTRCPRSRTRIAFAEYTHANITLHLVGRFPVQYSKTKGLLQLLHGVLGSLDRVADSPGVNVNLVIIATSKALVTEEVDVLVFGAAELLFSLDMLQTIGLVPASGENIERDLATNGETGFQTG